MIINRANKSGDDSFEEIQEPDPSIIPDYKH